MVETVGEIYESRKKSQQPTTQQSPPQPEQPPPKPPTPKPWSDGRKLTQSSQTQNQVDGQKLNQPAQPQNQTIEFDKIFIHLTGLKQRVSNRVRFMIVNLEELQSNKWKPRGGDKGPKTVAEVRDEVAQEIHENEQERIAVS